MKSLEKTLVNLSSSKNKDLLGHISVYELSSGNHYYIYFVNSRYYAAKEIDSKTGATVREEASMHDYHYNIDIFFRDKERYLGHGEIAIANAKIKGYNLI